MILISKAIRRALLLVAVLWAAGGMAQKADPARVKAHVEAATAAAGNDLKPALQLCKTAEEASPNAEAMRKTLMQTMAESAMEPAQVFDNLYFVGSKWVSTWALRTSAGLILIDAMDTDEEARTFIDGGLRKLGLNPADIRYLIITHAHGDHYGGSHYLISQFHPRVVMSETDWRELEKGSLPLNVLWGPPPKRDLAVKDGDKITLGDTTVELILTPGHTVGTLSVVLPVLDRGKKHLALLWGGTAFNFGKRADRLQMFMASAEKTAALVKQHHIDTLLSNHAGTDDSVQKIAALSRRKPGDPHPYVLGQAAVERFLTVVRECAAATLASFDAAALPRTQ